MRRFLFGVALVVSFLSSACGLNVGSVSFTGNGISVPGGAGSPADVDQDGEDSSSGGTLTTEGVDSPGGVSAGSGAPAPGIEAPGASAVNPGFTIIDSNGGDPGKGNKNENRKNSKNEQGGPLGLGWRN